MGRRVFTSFQLRIQEEYFQVTLLFPGQKTAWPFCTMTTTEAQDLQENARVTNEMDVGVSACLLQRCRWSADHTASSGTGS